MHDDKICFTKEAKASIKDILNMDMKQDNMYRKYKGL